MKKIIALSALVASLASAGAMAQDSNLTFTGQVTSSTCTLVSADATKTLTIPDVSIATLAASIAAYATQSASSSFNFSSCPASITKIVPTYSYAGSTATTVGLAAGSSNVALVLINSGGSAENVTGTVAGTAATVTSAGGAVIPFSVGVSRATPWFPSSPAPVAGNYTGVYNVTFNWS